MYVISFLCLCYPTFIIAIKGSSISSSSETVTLIKCGENQEWNGCAVNCITEPTCDNPYATYHPGEICSLQCEGRCSCKEGYVLLDNDTCIPLDSCPNYVLDNSTLEVLLCSENQEWNECTSNCMPDPSCENPNPTLPTTVCSLQCVGRCVCKEGYVLSNDNTCIQKGLCPTSFPECNPSIPITQCGEDQEWNDCASNCIPEPTCDNPDSTTEPDVVCTFQCVGRCSCKDGYVLSANDTCIPLNLCPNYVSESTLIKCGENQEWNECASSCIPEPTCANPYPMLDSDEVCTLQCVGRCSCKEGYVLFNNDTCLPLTMCSLVHRSSQLLTALVCGENQQFNYCASSCIPEPTCENPNPTLASQEVCVNQCQNRCSCKSGYVLVNYKTCILQDLCPYSKSFQCGDGQEWNSCANNCIPEPTCENPTPNIESGRFCTQQCVGRCSCKQGYVLETNDTCIPQELCPTESNEHYCGPNGYWSDCGNPCQPEPTCDCPNPEPISQHISCSAVCESRCSCDAGYVLNNGVCVKLETCPNYISPTILKDIIYHPFGLYTDECVACRKANENKKNWVPIKVIGKSPEQNYTDWVSIEVIEESTVESSDYWIEFRELSEESSNGYHGK